MTLEEKHNIQRHGGITVVLYNNNNNNNYYYYYLLQLGCYPVAVVILHVNKDEIGYY